MQPQAPSNKIISVKPKSGIVPDIDLASLLCALGKFSVDDSMMLVLATPSLLCNGLKYGDLFTDIFVVSLEYIDKKHISKTPIKHNRGMNISVYHD